MNPANAISTITGVLQDSSIIRALLLSGSYGAGLEDQYSDIDFLAVTVDGPSDEFANLWRKAVSQTGEIVLWWDRQVKSMLINAVTKEWLRIDVVVVKPDQMAQRPRNALKVLFDRDRIYDSLPAYSGTMAANPQRLKWGFEEFIRILGLLPLAMGREEYINAVTGVFHLRNLLIELLVEEAAAPNRGGALHLNRLITSEHKDLLRSLPPLLPTREAMMAAYLAYAEAYIPRARLMAKRLGIDWPGQFEAATWDHLKNELSIEPPQYLRAA